MYSYVMFHFYRYISDNIRYHENVNGDIGFIVIKKDRYFARDV